MSLSKKSRRNIADFNRARNPIYSGKFIDIGTDTKLESYVLAYQKLKEPIDDSTAC